MKKYLSVVLALLLPALVFAVVIDFTANNNITVSGVTFGSGSANMIIMNGSTAQSWSQSSGAFTVTNPGSAFNVGSADSAVKSIQITSSGSTVVCSANTTPGTSYSTLPTTAGTYTVIPSATTDCTSLCATLPNTATYNAFPTCGALSCSAGYPLSGSGSSATCVANNGPASVGLLTCKPGYVFSKPTESSSGWSCKPVLNPTIVTIIDPVIPSTEALVSRPSAVFVKNLTVRTRSADVRRLQILLATDKEIYPEGIVSGYYGLLTQKAVGKFQIKHGIVASPKAPGYGNVGPLTRAKLLVVFGK